MKTYLLFNIAASSIQPLLEDTANWFSPLFLLQRTVSLDVGLQMRWHIDCMSEIVTLSLYLKLNHGSIIIILFFSDYFLLLSSYNGNKHQRYLSTCWCIPAVRDILSCNVFLPYLCSLTPAQQNSNYWWCCDELTWLPWDSLLCPIIGNNSY